MHRFSQKMAVILLSVSPLFGMASSLLVQGPGLLEGKDSHGRYASFEKNLSKLMKSYGIPGASVAVAKEGKIVYERGFGYADKNKKILVTPSSDFRLASTSKTLTAIAILKLISEKKLSLTQKVYPYLGLTPLPGETENPLVNGITIQNLLEMSAGWDKFYDPMFGPWPSAQVQEYHLKTPMSCQSAARYMMGRPLVAKPGTRFAYQNIDYCLLGLVIAKASAGNLQTPEASYEAYMQGLFQSVGAVGMYLGSADMAKKGPNEVTYYSLKTADPQAEAGYVRLNDFPYSEDGILQDNYANGGWVAKASDVAKILMALEEGKWMPKQETHQLWDAPDGKPSGFHYFKGVQYLAWPYGMGMWRIQDHGHLLAMAHGSFTGTNTLVIRKASGEVDVALFNAKPVTPGALFSFRQKVIELLDQLK